MQKFLLRGVVFLLVPSLLLDPSVAFAFSRPSSASPSCVANPVFSEQALVASFAAAVFVGASMSPEPFVHHVFHFIKNHANEIGAGLQLGVVAALLGGGGQEKRTAAKLAEWSPAREFSGERYSIQRTAMLAILLPMKEEAGNRIDAAELVVKKAKKNVTGPQLGELSTAKAYHDRLRQIWDDVLATEDRLEDLLNHFKQMDREKANVAAVDELLKDRRIQFIRKLAWRTEVGTVQHGLFTRGSIEMVRLELMNLHLERVQEVGPLLDAYWTQVLEDLAGDQSLKLSEALRRIQIDGFEDLHPTGDPYGRLAAYEKGHGLQDDAAALFRFIMAFNHSSNAFKEAGALYLASYLFPQVVMNMLIPADREEAKAWVRGRPAGILKGSDPAKLRGYLSKDYRLDPQSDALLGKLKLARLSLFPEPRNGNGSGNGRAAALKARHLHRERGIAITPTLIWSAIVGLGVASIPPLMHVPAIAQGIVLLSVLGVSIAGGTAISYYLILSPLLHWMKSRTGPTPPPPGIARRLITAA